jgi:hypothetical protein
MGLLFTFKCSSYNDACFLPQPCVMMMQTAMYPWANRATDTGSVRADTPGCSAAPPCWCSTGDRWGVSCRLPRTARFQLHKRLCQMSWNKKGSKIYQICPPDPTAPLRNPLTCLQELCLFLWEAGQGINMTEINTIFLLFFRQGLERSVILHPCSSPTECVMHKSNKSNGSYHSH